MPHTTAPPAAPPPVAPRLAPLRVLVVDDFPDGRASTRLLIELWGYDCREAADGPAALAVAADFRPDVVLLELDLAGLDGLAVGRRMRADPATAGAVIVALTCRGRPADMEATRAAGFDCHLLKPVPPERLLQLIRRHHAGGRPG